MRAARLVGFGYGVMVVLVAAGLGAAPGTAAAHGGDPNLIHACVVPSSGTIRIIAPNGTCNPGQVPLDWNAQGVQGPPGPPGDQGPPGAPGQVQAPILVKFSSRADNTTHRKVAFAKCPEGTRAFGGGGEAFIADESGAGVPGASQIGAVAIKKSASDAQATGWGVTGERQDPAFTAKWWVTAHALCHAVAPTAPASAAPAARKAGAARQAGR